MNSTAEPPVILVLGAGAVTPTTGKRAAAEGCRAVLCRRTDQAGLDAAVGEIQEAEAGPRGAFSMQPPRRISKR